MFVIHTKTACRCGWIADVRDQIFYNISSCSLSQRRRNTNWERNVNASAIRFAARITRVNGRWRAASAGGGGGGGGRGAGGGGACLLLPDARPGRQAVGSLLEWLTDGLEPALPLPFEGSEQSLSVRRAIRSVRKEFSPHSRAAPSEAFAFGVRSRRVYTSTAVPQSISFSVAIESSHSSSSLKSFQ